MLGKPCKRKVLFGESQKSCFVYPERMSKSVWIFVSLGFGLTFRVSKIILRLETLLDF